MIAVRSLLLLMTTFVLLSCSSSPVRLTESASSDQPPPVAREFRGMWIATVANIDWPSRRNLPVVQQIDEMRQIVQTAKKLNFNALVLQVRPGADAIYPSPLEPWTEYLTGEQGRAPQPFYDPLATWISMAHENGLELHAWFNPYRARHGSAISPAAATHFSVTHPHAVRIYGDQQWMDPGEPDAARRTLEVIRDVVRRYDVDAVHIDDYFYPYPVRADLVPAVSVPLGGGSSEPVKVEVDFPDDQSWRAYQQTRGTRSRADWRRDNVNRLVASIHRVVHGEKPWLKFGISPFGLGRPDLRPPGIEGFSQYDKLYADVELWLREGWLDYLAPQLYWPMEQAAQAFPVLLRYWSSVNPRARHLWVGLFTSRINDTDGSWQPDEIVRQVYDTRTVVGVGGQIHFSSAALVQNRKRVGDLLLAAPYASVALVPESPWLRDSRQSKPAAPSLTFAAEPPSGADAGETVVAVIDVPERSRVSRFAVWTRYGNSWQFSVQSAATHRMNVPVRHTDGLLNRIAVAAVDRYGALGELGSVAIMTTGVTGEALKGTSSP